VTSETPAKMSVLKVEFPTQIPIILRAMEQTKVDLSLQAA
jgi:hypothetical protein